MIDQKTLIDIVGYIGIGSGLVALGLILYSARPKYLRKLDEDLIRVDKLVNALVKIANHTGNYEKPSPELDREKYNVNGTNFNQSNNNSNN